MNWLIANIRCWSLSEWVNTFVDVVQLLGMIIIIIIGVMTVKTLRDIRSKL